MTQRERELLSWIEEDPMISQQQLADRAGITRSSVSVHISNLMKKGLILGKGYVVQRRPYITVVGGANIDICGKPDGMLLIGDSNPGQVAYSMGGVGRNIAHNLVLLGEDVKLITAFGGDANAKWLADGCRRVNLDITYSLQLPLERTSSYLFVTDGQGDMHAAVSDMEIYERITPEMLEAQLPVINRGAVCVVDCNLSREALRFLCERCTCPLFVDPVSVTKAKRLEGLLSGIHTLKPNRVEAQLLSDVMIVDEETLNLAATKLLARGLTRVFITLGEHGVYCAQGEERQHLRSKPVPVVNASGAGDCFSASLVFSFLRGFSLEESGRLGMAASSICVAWPEAISPKLCEERLLEAL